jgi:hypothetical protein
MKQKPAHNSTYPKGGVSCSKESFVVKSPLIEYLQNVMANIKKDYALE